MFQCRFPVPLTSIRFEDKIKFSASQDLALARRKWINRGDRVNQSHELSSRPPDFSIRLFKCLKVPQSRDEKMLSNSSKPRRTKATQTVVPVVLQTRQRKEEPRKFITRYRPPDTLEVELRFVRNGKFPAAPYKNPEPHDFRPLEDDQPDFVTTFDRDPGNLNLKLKNLDTIRTIRSELDFSFRDLKTKMVTTKPAGPRWESRLVLPQSPWPPRPVSYTRHRRRRGAYSAFLKRVEEKLSNQSGAFLPELF
ncbi:putative uncharacterized protein C7orf78 homolog [Nelusetta ayraudi]|uniref:putative uncharacterized protein C7orf78 homolog n=1 Tax=Nelusetta ayraudi TaxID=303726 RepID=UPI003F6F2318